ncbi:PDZ domain-containing protein GIPC3-like protein [Dinothrombium tinctorium]|uniref:PDZ domain-containing protein GIPC3-like protein n=1 Tax=Dinothrombium tinctorium TaxID=1965070 RepID=A0A3S3NWQ6_9ACAR|nr:PDZ domain-containing protein GIPC3-like protein [Dinothrombium tinctorium]RWS05045.1 PDZ domain-containing protein GIPC3-like protein [Dinothrombium tinctorium]RWS09898.1 PDZ domain-containing protein GIPC3-like protein [Dinothrombium tinctorium]
MPLFGAKKRRESEEDIVKVDHLSKNGITNTAAVVTAANNSTANSLISKLSFPCQLAHGSPTVFVSGFSSMRQLYEKIAECFDIPSSEILYCTLNTHKVNMDNLLGGQIGLEDFIFVHCKGQNKEIEITKNDQFLGLTITDNGNGYSFIKKIKNGSLIESIKFVEVGDVIEKINGQCLIGCRHFEVAKALKDIRVGNTFTLRLIEPCKNGFSLIGPRDMGTKKAQIGSGKETLRLRSTGPATVEEYIDKVEEAAVYKINGLLETFMGIHDNDLSIQIWTLGRDKNNPHDFMLAIDSSDLEVFGFSDEFIFDLWGAINDAKAGRLN